jgi:hypothetical protein
MKIMMEMYLKIRRVVGGDINEDNDGNDNCCEEKCLETTMAAGRCT